MREGSRTTSDCRHGEDGAHRKWAKQNDEEPEEVAQMIGESHDCGPKAALAVGTLIAPIRSGPPACRKHALEFLTRSTEEWARIVRAVRCGLKLFGGTAVAVAPSGASG